MKHKKIKISSNTLFVFRPKSGSHKANESTDPTTTSVTITSAIEAL